MTNLVFTKLKEEFPQVKIQFERFVSIEGSELVLRLFEENSDFCFLEIKEPVNGGNEVENISKMLSHFFLPSENISTSKTTASQKLPVNKKDKTKAEIMADEQPQSLESGIEPVQLSFGSTIKVEAEKDDFDIEEFVLPEEDKEKEVITNSNTNYADLASGNEIPVTDLSIEDAQKITFTMAGKENIFHGITFGEILREDPETIIALSVLNTTNENHKKEVEACRVLQSLAQDNLSDMAA